ncbi:hypothetical protein [Pseudomonas sp. LRF_L74]|uniref:hypothetical protein n=1 Tax=Pseudomonas sp. LRF_L74 TaxID=3369422 RepID=UPI003F5FEDF7
MNPAARRYVVSCSSLMLVYAGLVALISWGIDLQQLSAPLRLLAAVSPAIPLAGVILVFDRYLRSEPDEFLRFLMSRAAALAGGVVICLISAWGFLEQYANVPRFPLLLIFPLFWAAYAFTSIWVRYRHA